MSGCWVFNSRTGAHAPCGGGSRRPIWSGLAALLLAWPTFARGEIEAQPYRIDTWQVEDGLPQSSVTSILQTRDGYLWLGTFNGLVRFDGVRFKVFNPNTTPGLPSGRVVRMFEDRAGTLWIGTEEGSLVRYGDNAFETVTRAGQAPMPGYIRAFAEATEPGLWMITSDRRLVEFAGGRLEFDPTHGALRTAGLATDRDGRLWVSTDRGICVLRRGKVETVFEQARPEALEPGTLAPSRRGGCWAALNGGLRRFNEGRCVEDLGIYPWSKGDLFCMLEDRAGQLWVGTYGSGLFRFSTNGAVLHLSSKEGLPGDLIRSLCQDREGNLWVGTEGDGLARLKPAIFQCYGRQQGLSGDCILSVCEGQEGELWIGTNGDGVNRLQRGAVQRYGPREGLTNECVWSVFEDSNRTLWAGTWGAGLFRLEGEHFVPVAGMGGASGVVCALHQEPGGRLWVGAQDEGPEVPVWWGGRPEVFRLQNPRARADVRAVATDAAGNLWLGTQSDGLYCIHGEHQTHLGRNEGLSNESIRSLYADRDGVIWIGTYGGGLDRLDWRARAGTPPGAGDGPAREARPRFCAFTTRDGLPSDALCYITEDRRSNLWCGSLGGVFRLEKAELNRAAAGGPRSLHCLSYTTVDGLPTAECSGGCQPSGCKTRDGRLWFPTVRGLAVVNPEEVPFNPLPPPVVIEEVVIEGKNGSAVFNAPSPATPRASAGKESPSRARLAVPAGNRRLEFHYTGLSLVAPRKVQFQYKLEGLEEEWVNAGPRRAANYSYLRPGDYRFVVRACNNDGVWNEAGASLAVMILPYFWQTWWFRVLAGLTVLLGLVGIYELRLASARKLGRLRLRIARDLHDEIGSNLGSIALLSEVMPKPPGGTAEEVSEIRRIALQTISSLRDIVWFLDPAADSMEELVQRMRETAKTMLHGIPFEFTVSGDASGAVPSLELRRNVFPAFKEMVHNVVKHARATRVEIAVAITSRNLELRVSDNGVGFERGQAGGGNGLKNLRRRAAELAGTFEVRSEPGKGTAVSLLAPIT